MDTGDYVNYSSGNTACQGLATENYVGGVGIRDWGLGIRDWGLGIKKQSPGFDMERLS